MYVIKNALKCISRSKGRNILIGIIVLVIAVSACIGLSIRQAAISSKETTLDGLTITADISYDFQSKMDEMMNGGTKPTTPGERPSFDKSGFQDMMSDTSSLTLEEYKTYAGADSVKDFYYSVTVSVDGNDEFEPVSTTSESKSNNNFNMGGGKGPGGFGGMSFGSSSDFQIVGYSSEKAMTEFVNGTATLSDGEFFAENTEEMNCIISNELATYNELIVGDTITITNPKSEDETYTLKVVGLFNNASSGLNLMGMGGMRQADPVNMIYMSYNALASIISQSEATAESNSIVGTKLNGSIDATYVFADVESYEKFDAQARELGLSEEYSISSSDLAIFESSLVPLETLSTMAGWFLLVILIIGAIILIVLNIFNVRERKYEIGVLTAMGMKKGKVASQFIAEIFVVTMIAVVIGIVVGAVASVPVTNALLENQIESQTTQSNKIEENFGRVPGGNMPDNMGGFGGMGRPDMSNGFAGFAESVGQMGTQYITEIDSAMNFTVVLQMLGIAILLTLVSGAVSVLFVMRYDPLKILANRD